MITTLIIKTSTLSIMIFDDHSSDDHDNDVHENYHNYNDDHDSDDHENYDNTDYHYLTQGSR